MSSRKPKHDEPMKEFTVQIVEVKVTVRRYPYGNFWEAVAYEPATDHGCITTIDGKWFGRVSSLRFNSNLPFGEERSERCNQHYDRVQLRSRKLIRDAFQAAGVPFPKHGNWNLGCYEFTA